MSPTCRITTCLTLLLLSATLTPAAVDSDTVYVSAGRLLDVERGEVLRQQAILIRGDRIVQLGPAADISRPADALHVDLSGAMVLPGLIDCHTHLTSDHRFHGYRQLGISTPRQALYGALNAGKTLDAGFTTVRNVGAGGYADIALRDAIHAGEIPGPRMQASGPALGITGGHCDNNLLPPRFEHRSTGVADGPWAVRAKVREVIKYGADLIKTCATGGVLSKGTDVGAPQYTLEELQAIVEEAHKRGRKVAAHAHGAEGIKLAIRAGIDSIDHASLIDAEGIRLARKHGTFLVMDIYNDTYILEHGASVGMLPESLEKERQIGQLQRDNFRLAFEAGVPMAFGSDSAVYPHGDNGKQFAYMVEYGMTPMQAIQAATIGGAELMGWSDRVGAIRKGLFADLIAVEGDPLADVTVLEKVPFVMTGGKIFKNDLDE